MDEKGLSLSKTVWSQLDRKAGAIIELTIRQLRNRMSTWVVLGVGILLMVLLLAFYVDSVREGFESIDNDGDSVDMDGDGYPLGQEIKYGYSDYDSDEFPGSSEYVRVSNIDYDDQIRRTSGNFSWEGIGRFDAIWKDTNYSGSEWDGIIDWNIASNNSCDSGDVYVDWSPDYWGYACYYSDDEFFVYGKFKANGTIDVPLDRSINWGYYTQPFFIEPDPQSMYINEDDIDWNGNLLQSSQGFDDDGDCTRENWSIDNTESAFYFDYSGDQFDEDKNNNGIICDVLWEVDGNGDEISSISPDSNVDEDPDDEKYMGESSHRTFIIGVGKMAFVILLGLFLPLFLALGLIRDETENGTLHYLLSKPIHRGEFIAYRLLGYLSVTGSYVIILSLLVGIITALLGPGDEIFRISDIPVWLGIGFATFLVLAAYGALFNTLGLISPKYGVYVSIVIGVWPETLQLQQMSSAFNLETGLDIFWKPPVHTLGTSNPIVAIMVSMFVLIVFTIMMLVVGQSVFKNREIM